jgi:hypothetical protein
MHHYASMGGIVPFHRILPGRFTQRSYLLPISGWHRAHPLRSKTKKHSSGSSHTNPLLHADPDPFWIQNNMSRWQGGLPSWLRPTSPKSYGSAVTHGLMPTSIQIVWPSLMDSCLRLPPQSSTFGACSCRSLHLKNSIPNNSM